LRQHIIAALIHDLSGDRALAIERVHRDNRAFQRQQLQKFRNGGDLIGFAIDGELAQHKPLIGRPCADEMERRFLGGTVEGASQRLAVYGDNALDRLGEFPDEDKEAGVELDGIEQAEDAAEGVWLGMPCRKERNSRKNASFARPKSATSEQSSAPHNNAQRAICPGDGLVPAPASLSLECVVS